MSECTLKRFMGIALGVALMAATLLGVGCGGAKSGGSGAAPTGGGEAPVAVEIPAVTDIADVTYITSPVVTVAGMDLSAKSASQKSLSALKNISMQTEFAGTSANACEATNITRGLLENGSHSDLLLCLLQNNIAPNIPNIYDGNNHDAAAWFDTGKATALVYLRFNITKDSTGAITKFITDVCSQDPASGKFSQSEHTVRTINPLDNTIIISTKSVEGSDYTSKLDLTGTLKSINNTFQYSQKTITHSSRQDQGAGVVLTQKATLDQNDKAVVGTIPIGTIDGFQHHVGVIAEDDRSFGKFLLDYTGDPEKDLELYDYVMKDGASELIEAESNINGSLIDTALDQTQCWDADGKVTTSPCAPYTDALKTPMTVSDVPAVSFVGNEVVDCTLIKPEYTAGTNIAPLTLDNTRCGGFGRDLNDHMDCFKDIYRDFAITVTIKDSSNNPTVLSTDKLHPAPVGASPTILVTTNFTPYESSFQTGTFMLTQDPPWEGNVLSDSNFAASNWSSGATIQNPEARVLTLHPMLNPFHGTYTFTIGTDASGLNNNHMPAPLTYYITP